VQLIAHDDHRLVIHQGPWALRFMGALLVFVGAAVLVFICSGHLGEHNAWVAVVVGGVFALVGLAMTLGARDVLCTFDRGRRDVTLRARGLFGAATHIYAWKDIDDVALEKSTMSDGRNGPSTTTFRPVLVMHGGTRVPWTQVLTGDQASQAACVAAARAFGGWHALPVDAKPAHADAVRKAVAEARRVRYIAAPLLGLFVVVGVALLWQQWRRYEMWRPTRVVITAARVDVVRGNKGDSYRPAIAYRYVDATGAHHAAGATILSMSSSASWAAGIANRYTVGDSATAYIDPGNPDRGFVERKMSWVPLIAVVFPLLAGALIVHALNWQTRQAELPGSADVPILSA
jgi:hypothetical protein